MNLINQLVPVNTLSPAMICSPLEELGSGCVHSVVLSDYPQAVGMSAQAMWFYCQTNPVVAMGCVVRVSD